MEEATMDRLWLLVVVLLALVTSSGSSEAQIIDDVNFVGIHVFDEHTNNVRASPPQYDTEITICGNGLPPVTVTPPGLPPVVLEDIGGGCWDRPSEPGTIYPTAPIGTFVFSFQGSAETVAVVYNPVQTTCFPIVTFPTPGAPGASLQPVFQWDDASACASGGLEVFVDGPDRDEEPGGVLPVTATSWDPWTPGGDALLAALEYELNISAFNSSSTSSPFLYQSSFAHSNNVSFTTTCPENPATVHDEIQGVPACGPAGDLTVTWGTFGSRDHLAFDSGEELRLRCVASGVNFYELEYTSPHGGTTVIGGCPFEGGCNSAWFLHSGDSDGDTHPDCLVTSRWISRDHGANDIPNPWTGEPLESPALLDWADWSAPTTTTDPDVSMVSEKYEYAFGPPVPVCADPPPEGNLVSSTVLGPPSSLLTRQEPEAGLPIDGFEGPAGLPMEFNTQPSCDLTGDSVCDDADVAEVASALGTCLGDPAYNPLADRNGDGCVTVDDGRYIPEPGWMPSLAAGFVLVGLLYRWRERTRR
jgi:hypothetical protein